MSSDRSRARLAAALTRWTRRRVITVIAAALVVTVGVGWLAYAASYAPLTESGWGGLEPSSPAGVRDALADRWRIDGPAGTEVQLMMGVRSTGPVPVRIDGVDLDHVVVSARWSLYHLTPGGAISGDARPWREFNATLPAHGELRLMVTIRQLDCAVPANHGQGFDYITVRWHALGIGHSTRLNFQKTVDICPV